MERLAANAPRTPDRLDRPLEDPLLYELFPALATSVEWDLARSHRALAMVGDPHRSYVSLHVGGTNGKGSVTSTLASIMRATGRRSGCYLSPHLVSFTERILVDGRPLAEDTLKEYAAEVRKAVTECGLTFFEAVTLLAFHAFSREGVDVAALEVGLGGRLDATNVVTPGVSAVTNVAMDHADYLGDSLLAIAREKAGIMKAGVPFVTTEQAPEVLDLFGRVAAEIGAPLTVVSPEQVRDVVVAPAGTTFAMSTAAWGELEVATPLVGAHQALNTALAIAACEALGEGLRPDRETLLRGISTVRHRGRDEVVEIDGHTWLFDVAHNPAGVESLVDTLDRLELARPLVAVVGILADKDWRQMVSTLLTRCDQLILTQPPTAPLERRWDLGGVAAELRNPGRGGGGGAGDRVVAIADLELALDEARALAGEGTVVVTGSVHTVGGALRVLGAGAGAE